MFVTMGQNFQPTKNHCVHIFYDANILFAVPDRLFTHAQLFSNYGRCFYTTGDTMFELTMNNGKYSGIYVPLMMSNDLQDLQLPLNTAGPVLVY